MKEKELEPSNTQSCVASTSNEDKISYDEATTIAEVRKWFVEV